MTSPIRSVTVGLGPSWRPRPLIHYPSFLPPRSSSFLHSCLSFVSLICVPSSVPPHLCSIIRVSSSVSLHPFTLIRGFSFFVPFHSPPLVDEIELMSCTGFSIGAPILLRFFLCLVAPCFDAKCTASRDVMHCKVEAVLEAS